MAEQDRLAEQFEERRSYLTGVAYRMETLNPAERIAFVLHDAFAVAFDEIAPIPGRSLDAEIHGGLSRLDLTALV
jgi:hypothetical protein